MDGANGGTSFPDVNAGGSAHTWTAHSATTVTSGQQFGTACMQSPYIDTPAHADYNRGSSDFAIDFWFDSLAIGNGTTRYMAGQTPSTLAFANLSFLFQLDTGNTLTATVSNGAGYTTVTSTSTFAAAGRNFVMFRRNGNTLELWINGAMEDSAAFSGPIQTSTAAYAIGRGGERVIEPFAGLIDEWRDSIGIARATTVPTQAYS